MKAKEKMDRGCWVGSEEYGDIVTCRPSDEADGCSLLLVYQTLHWRRVPSTGYPPQWLGGGAILPSRPSKDLGDIPQKSVSGQAFGMTVTFRPVQWPRLWWGDWRNSWGIPCQPEHHRTQTNFRGRGFEVAYSTLNPEEPWLRRCHKYHPTEISTQGRLFPGQPVQCLFLVCLLPSEVTQAMVKAGKDPKFAEYLRSISLLSSTLKVFEWLVQQQLQDHLKWFNILVPKQFGFQTGDSSMFLISWCVSWWPLLRLVAGRFSLMSRRFSVMSGILDFFVNSERFCSRMATFTLLIAFFGTQPSMWEWKGLLQLLYLREAF